MYYHREDLDQGIRELVAEHPKTFFEDPSLRRPLKLDILADLEKEGSMDREKLVHTLDWYMSHYTYRRGLIAGAEQIDLEGRKAGTVTAKEQQEARAWVVARKKQMAELQQLTNNLPTARVSAARAGAANKPNEAVMPKTAATTPPLHHSLSEMQAAIGIVNNIMTDHQYEPLRPALATAALEEIIGKAERLIGSLRDGEAPEWAE